MGADERGNISTITAKKRRRNNLMGSTTGFSYATASVATDLMSKFSFHPEINRNSKWKPKYDDHHDHKRLWTRMHDENRKISNKRRLMSQEKERQEMAA